MRRAPSKKMLQSYFPDIHELQADDIRNLIHGDMEPEAFHAVRLYAGQCLNGPRDIELIMVALNHILQGYGVEAITISGADVDSYWHDCIGTYVNMGDTYTATIVYDTERDRFVLSSWGDFYEAREKKYKVCPHCGVSRCQDIH